MLKLYTIEIFVKSPIRRHFLSSQRAPCPFPKSFAHATSGQLSVEKPNSFFRGAAELQLGKMGRCFDGKKPSNSMGEFAMKPTKRTVKRGKAYTRYTINHPEVRFIHRYTLELICVIAKCLLPWKVTLIGSAAKPFWDEYQGAMFWVESLCYVRWGYLDRCFKTYTGIYSKASRYGYLSN